MSPVQMMGLVVNMAARLMCKGNGGGTSRSHVSRVHDNYFCDTEVIVDENTKSECVGCNFEPRVLTLKGRSTVAMSFCAWVKS